MKRFFLIFLVFMTYSMSAFAAELSSDTMILKWTTNKVWVSNGDLCISGVFKNYRDDIVITKINSFMAKVIFTRDDDTTFVYKCSPVKIPICKISGKNSKTMSFNLGKFDLKWKKWLADAEYTYTYIGIK